MKTKKSRLKLQKAVGHSPINVSLTYLRGLEIEELKEKTIGLKLHSFNEDLDSFTTYYLQE